MGYNLSSFTGGCAWNLLVLSRSRISEIGIQVGNPYESPDSNVGQRSASDYSPRQRTLQGVIIGGSIPLVLGVLMLIRFRMSLPVIGPGEAHCGTGALGPICILLFGSPIGAIMEGITGAKLCRLWLHTPSDTSRLV